MLELKDITYQVSDDNVTKNIINHLDLSIGDGKFVVITGPNGGGKSTIARLIMGVNNITSGQILFDGTDITDKNITERANLGISFAFQQPVHFKGIRVIDLLRMASGKQISVSEACEYLSKVGLCAKEYIEREINSSLSGGELKRIEIATVLARGTKFSIFDEPEAGIDLWSFQNLIQVFENIRESIKGTVLIISHQERILEIADEIVLIEDGKVKKQGTKDEILPELLGTTAAVNSACSKLV
ncbi:MAG: ATP-binding cassette domain-containing protein [Agathobacter sp.]|nr:ATP-binding cassette domain-containing protein [Agathobacter sp.]